MKISSLCVGRWNGDTVEPVLFAQAKDVGEFGFMARGGAKQMLTMVSRLLLKRVTGLQCVTHEGYNCFVYVKSSGLGAVAVCDKEYPDRVANDIIRQLLTDFEKTYPVTKWRSIAEDDSLPFPQLETTLTEYQNPEKVDKMMKIQRDLEETKDVLHKTIEAVLERGERLEDIVDKSNDLSAQSKQFYKQAKKTNQCCVIM